MIPFYKNRLPPLSCLQLIPNSGHFRMKSKLASVPDCRAAALHRNPAYGGRVSPPMRRVWGCLPLYPSRRFAGGDPHRRPDSCGSSAPTHADPAHPRRPSVSRFLWPNGSSAVTTCASLPQRGYRPAPVTGAKGDRVPAHHLSGPSRGGPAFRRSVRIVLPGQSPSDWRLHSIQVADGHGIAAAEPRQDERSRQSRSYGEH